MTADTPRTGDRALRCFIALLPDAASRQLLERWRAPFQRGGSARGVRWLDATALHMTLRFLGNTRATQREHLQRVLPALARALPPIASRRVAIWPNRARPRLLVLDLSAPAELSALASQCEALAMQAGFAPEPRAFRAHLTLARLRPGCALALPVPAALALRFDSLALMQSTLTASGARYAALARAPIGEVAAAP